MGMNLFSFVIVLGVLIFFHELGHFLVARFFGVGVDKFSLGFGPRIFGRKIGRTDYCLSAIPLGGFVKMVGEDTDSPVSPEDKAESFAHKHVFKRILIVAAGPVFNFVLAVLIFYLLFQVTGVIILTPTVGSVQENSPALSAGIEKGDVIKKIGNVPIQSWNDMSEQISACKGRDIELEVLRNGSLINLSLIPRLKVDKNVFGEDVDRYVIGIISSGETYTKPLNPFEAFSESIRQTIDISVLTVKSVVKMIQGSVSAKSMGGPIMIAQMAGDQARAGAMNFVFFIALLSINLGILNLLPVPVLDGGHLLFFGIEAVIGRPVSMRVREIAQQFGFFMLISLMLFVCYNDIIRGFSE